MKFELSWDLANSSLGAQGSLGEQEREEEREEEMEEERERKRRERNKLAATRCREKKRAKLVSYKLINVY